MACCGRAVVLQPPPHRHEPGGHPTPGPERVGTPLTYVGPTALTAVGPLTGRRYRFGHPGAIVEVDPRDAAAMLAIPGLRTPTRT